MLAAPIPWPPSGPSMPWRHPNGSAILVLVNFHRFLNSPEIIQAVAKQILAGKNNRTFLVILSPLVQIPPELEKQIIVVEHELTDPGATEKFNFWDCNRGGGETGRTRTSNRPGCSGRA